ncbi:SDR family NAD(P)-dependent oxidoreductase [Pedobacter sp. KBW06]|uniref:SDR family NAD(P)-dependent oxidoreductase n=1 Tax=Pedobacter sp. KBW06 TaxID=2153359 RepID=UPI001F23D907|nr:SDR family NAD(P)-dependent oxidoreductase [Pedobacter sp. KBW06]
MLSNAGVPAPNAVKAPFSGSGIVYNRSRYWPEEQLLQEEKQQYKDAVRDKQAVMQGRSLDGEVASAERAFMQYLQSKTFGEAPEWIVQLTFDHKNYILRDHRVHEVRIVPGVTYLDMVLRTAKELFGEELMLNKVLFTSPLATTESFNRLVEIRYSLGKESLYEAAIYSSRINKQGDVYGEWEQHMECRLEHLQKTSPERFDIAGFIENSDAAFEMSAVYAMARTMNIWHGDFMQTRGKLYQRGEEELMVLQLSEQAEHYRDQFFAPPPFLDGATFAGSSFGLSEGTGLLSGKVPYIPFSIDQFQLLQALPSILFVYSRKQVIDTATLPEVVKNDILLYNEEGTYLGGFKNLTSKRIRHPELIRQLIAPLGDGFQRAEPAIALASPLLSGGITTTAVKSDFTEHRDQAGQAIRIYLRELLSARLLRPAAEIEEDRGFYDLGLDSKQTMELVRDLEQKCGHDFYPSLLFEYQTIAELSTYLQENDEVHFITADLSADRGTASLASTGVPGFEQEATSQSSSEAIPPPGLGSKNSSDDQSADLNNSSNAIDKGSYGDDPIAIIGLSGRYPGAKDLDEFWENLSQGRNSIVEIPEERWDSSLYFDPEKGKTGTSYSKWGGFISDADKFDPLFFNIPPAGAENMDPQARLFLQESWKTVEDAGYTAKKLADTEKVGVFAGVFWTDYQLYRAGGTEEGFMPSSFVSMAANTVSYHLGFRGPSIGIDTQCSSSLTAIHLACESIHRGESTMALAGGVNLSLHPSKYTWLSNSMFLSSKGTCESFGKGGDGYVPGEGVGVVLLKRLSRAKADGDRIYGVIKGTAVNHGGRSSGFTVPNLRAQSAVIREAISRAGIQAGDISYIEAHGTGTSLGDPIEIAGLSQVFPSEKSSYCSIGSVKSNIGHGESAAGISGLSKVLLQFRHQQLVPSLHSSVLNPNIDFKVSPFRVQQELEAWLPENDKLRIAGISSFGAGGSNAHLIVEEYLPELHQPYVGKGAAVILLSAKNGARLKDQVQNLFGYLESQAGLELYSIAYTLQIGREAMEERLAMTAGSLDELKAKLSTYLEGEAGDFYTGNIKKDQGGFVLEGRAGEAYIREAISAQEAGSLAQIWVKGIQIDWSLLYQGAGRKPEKIGLPTYPFARERYWLPDDLVSSVKAPGQVSGKLHPLLHRNESDFMEQKYVSTYSGEEHFFKDHKVAGEKVLPGVAYLEMAREAGERSLRQKITQLKNVTWLSPLKVKLKAEEVTILLHPSAEEAGYKIYTTGESEVLHCSGIVGSRQLQVPETYNLNSISGRLAGVKDAENYYKYFKERGLEYGPAFKGIEKLYYSEEEALSKIVLPLEKGYVLSPGILDSALQTCAGLIPGAGGDSLSLPFFVKTVNIYGELSSPMWAYVRKSNSNKSGNAAISYDIDLMNEEGEVALRMEGFVTLPVRREPQASLDRPSVPALHLYDYSWKEQELTSEEVDAPELHVLLAGGSANLADQLSEGLEAEVSFIAAGSKTTYFNTVFQKIKDQIRQKSKVNLLIVYKNDDYLEYAFVAGLLKTAMQESPGIKGKIIGVDGLELNSSEELLRILERERGVSPGDTEIRYQRGKRETKQFQSYDIRKQVQQPVIKEGGVYLITGGLGEIGKLFGRYIAGFKNTCLIFTGRQELTKEKENALSDIPNWEYHCCDISKKASVADLMLKIREKHLSINGIIHSAGVIHDGLIVHKTQEQIDEVLACKIAGVEHLDESSSAEPLDFMVLFSSLSGITGNIGQADYASANAYLDHYARSRNEQKAAGLRQGQTLSINWPYWENGGMQIDEHKLEYLRNKWGMLPMPSGEGIAAFEALLSGNTDQAAVIYGLKEKFYEKLVGAKANPAEKPLTGKEVEGPDQSELISSLKEVIAKQLKLNITDLEADVDFSEYGMDSILIMKILHTLESRYEIVMDPTSLINYPTIDALAAYMETEMVLKPVAVVHTELRNNDLKDSVKMPSSNRFVNQSLAGNQPKNSGKVAIIGMSCRLPQADDLSEFWENLKSGKDTITETPANRWDILKHYSEKAAPDKTYTTKGGFLKNPGLFDAKYFKISDDDAISMDPQQRIILELSRELLSHAGYRKEELANSHTGVYLGAKDNNYIRNHYHLMPKASYKHTVVNSISNMTAARVSDFYNLKGVSKVIDTACSSSLVAIHDACDDILSGKVKMAIAGGISIMTDPFSHIGFSQAEVLSRDGKSYVFDERANGFVLAEGGGLVMLKEYSQAKADGDQIFGVIIGSDVNNDGHTMGLTVPNKEGQKSVIENALRKSGISAEKISYYEAHGTGTLLGDPIEVQAAAEVYASYSGNKQYCAIGAVKSNLGHNMTAAGVTGLIKILLQMQHRLLVPTLNCDNPHPRFKFPESPFYPNTSLKKWEAEHAIAAISSFGFGGTNCHMLIEAAENNHFPGRAALPVERSSGNHYWLGQEIIKREMTVRATEERTEAVLAQTKKLVDQEVDRKPAAEAEIRKLLQQEIAGVLQVPSDEISFDESFMELGLSSTQLIGMTTGFSAKLEIELYPTLLFQYDTIRKLAECLLEEFPKEMSLYLKFDEREFQQAEENEKLVGLETETAITGREAESFAAISSTFDFPAASVPSAPKTGSIAVIGLSGRFPGSAQPEIFWQNLKDNLDLITEIPSDRWNWEDYYGNPAQNKNKTKAKWGGFIADIDKFDPLFFNISPAEAELMDPQQRITLEAVYTALEDAGLSVNALKGTNTGTFIGVSSLDYSVLINKKSDLSGDALFSTGAAHSVLVNRISYLLDIHGPSEPIDTACSSSLIAIHKAVENIRNGHCDMAIAGGVNAMLSPELTLSFSQAGMLSEEGRCRTFDQGANGYVRAEGVGILILKSLDKAEADGDHIYGVIRGTAVNHGGKANSLTSPNPSAQKELLLKAYRSANIDPRDVSYIEAHGTGTPLGDPIETEGLKQAFKALYKDRGLDFPAVPHCSIGSVKTNIGHLEAAAGIAGVVKVLLALKHRILPGNPHLKTPNEYLKLKDTPFHLQKETREWTTENNKLRIAGISSFGFGGSNAHLILQEYRAENKKYAAPGGAVVILLSARNSARLREQAKNLSDHLELHPDVDLHRMAYTLQTGREAMEERLAMTANDLNELKRKLHVYLEGKSGDFYTGNIKKDGSGFILEGKAGQAYIREAIAEQEAGSLAQLWVKGVNVDWSLLYPGLKPKKVSLPTYPFARERYWIPDQSLNLSDPQTGKLHPLLHRNESDLSAQKYTSIFTGQESFLKDDRIAGEKILPGLVALEMAREAGERSLGQKITQLREISWQNPLKIGSKAVELNIRLYPSVEAGGSELHTAGYEVYTAGAEETRYGQGILSSRQLSFPEPYDLDLMTSRLAGVKQAYYPYLKEQGIEKLYHSTDEALSEIVLPLEKGYVLSPGLLERALQTCEVLMPATDKGALSLLFFVNVVNIHAELSGRMWAYARKRENNAGGNTVVSFDIDLINEQGEVALRMEDFMILQATGPDSGPKEKVAAAECTEHLIATEQRSVPALHLYDYSWKEQELINTAGHSSEIQVLLAGGSANLADQLSEGLEAEVSFVPAGTKVAYFKAVFQKIKDKIRQKSSVNLLIVYKNEDYLEYAFVAGLLKTAMQESPKIKGKIIGVDGLEVNLSEELLRILEDEREPSLTDIEIRYQHGKRETKQFRPFDFGNQVQQPLIKEGGVYLITGGLGEIGKVFGRYIAGFKNTRLIFTGRRELSREHEDALSDIPNWEYHRCDLSKKADVAALMSKIREKHVSVNGIIHGAGVIQDSLIVHKTNEQIDEVLACKIAGVEHLDEASSTEPLDFMVLFSSLSAVTGNIGQADYASANAYLDHYSRYRNEQKAGGLRQGHTLSINWPYWEKGGMQIAPDQLEYLRSKWGIFPMPSAMGITAFENLLSGSSEQGVVIYGLKEKSYGQQLAGKIDDPVGFGSEKNIPAGLQKKVEESIIALVGEVLKVEENHIKLEDELGDYGFDSILITRFCHQLNEYYGLALLPTSFYHYPTAGRFSQFLLEEHLGSLIQKHGGSPITGRSTNLINQPGKGLNSVAMLKSPLIRHHQFTWNSKFGRGQEETRQDNTAVAVIGMSGRFPGSPDLAAFWENLKANKDLIVEIPEERWDWKAFYGDPKQDKHKTKAKWGGFIDDIDKFDPLFFNISPMEAELMDPQHRIAIETVYHALEDAGINVKDLSGSDTGVFIGSYFNDYSSLVQRHGLSQEAQSITGLSHSILTNRISYLFNLTGPSEPVDTACSSSLIAIHRAVENIRSGSCRIVIAGGGSLDIIPETLLPLSQAGMLSEDGRCKTFDQAANGYVRGEGVGMLVLKSLKQAEADGDRIYAVIRGTSVNHGGKANSLTSPNPAAQKELLMKAYRSANIDPRDVSYIEAHGTGTPLGDPIETEALKLAFKALYKERGLDFPAVPHCSIGSVKTNIGHLEAAAGIAGVVKVLLSLKHKILPGNPQLKTPNAYLQLDGTPFSLQKDTTEWAADNHKARISGVSSFGFGGSNAHLILEEYRSEKQVYDNGNRPVIILLSARNVARLKDQVKNLADHLLSHPDEQLHSIAYTLQTGREAMEERLALTAGDLHELSAKLNAYLEEKPGDFYTGNIKRDSGSFVLDGKAGEAYIHAAISAGEVAALAELWVKGIGIDWLLLYPGKKPQKISLPTYPFARERYWIPDQQVKSMNGAVTGSGFSADILYMPLWERKSLSALKDPGLEEIKGRSGRYLIITGASPGLFAAGLAAWLESEGAKLEILASLSDLKGPLHKGDHIYFTAGLDRELIGADSGKSVSDTLDGGLEAETNVKYGQHELHLFRSIKTLLDLADPENELYLELFTCNTQKVVSGDQVSVSGSGIPGLLGSLAREYEKWQVRVTDLETEVLEPDGFRRLFSTPYDVQDVFQAYRSGHLYRRVLSPLQLNPDIESRFRKGGTYVILGGAGGIGKVTTAYLAEKYGATVIWLGRSAANDKISASQEEISKKGPRPVYIQCDATKKESVDAAFREIKENHKLIHGLFHSALVLNDQLMTNMTEADFSSSFDPKATASHHLVNAFKGENLDFICFYSSAQSQWNAPGQGNYSSGCMYKDSYARQVSQRLGIRTHVINWGYWGEVGVVSSAEYRQRMLILGIESISIAEGMQVLETLIANDQEQAVVLKLSKQSSSKINSLLANQQIIKAELTDLQLQEVQVPEYRHAEPYESRMFQICVKSFLQVLQELGLEGLNFKAEVQKETNRPLQQEDRRLLVNKLRTILGISDKYARLFQSMLDWLQEMTHIKIDKDGISISAGIKDELADFDLNFEIEQLSAEQPVYKAHLDLLLRCLFLLKEIFTGKVRAVDVIFPDGSLAYVKGIYTGNHTADYFNELLTTQVAESIIAAIGKKENGDKLRIMEIGAGTGGTSEMLFRKLAGYEASIVYVYTDISRTFLLHAERNYKSQTPYLQTALFDIEESPAVQGIATGSFDVVLGTNVVHATKNISIALRNIKAVLKKGGLLMLNEIARTDLYSTLTFGLLDGWWLYEDPEVRMEGGPGLSGAGWSAVLAEQGFEQTKIYPEGLALPQQIIIAASDGVITIPRAVELITASSQPKESIAARSSSGQAPAKQETSKLRSQGLDSLSEELIRIASETVKLPVEAFEDDRPFSEYGFDSILGTTLTKNINEALNILLKSTDIFNYPSIKELSEYIHGSYGDDLISKKTLPSAEEEDQAEVAEEDDDAIAIVALGGVFSGAGDSEQLWEQIMSGNVMDGTVEVKSKGTSFHYGAIAEVFQESHIRKVGLTPEEFSEMGRQQKLIFGVLGQAIEESGIALKALSAKRTGVFIGSQQLLPEADELGNISVDKDISYIIPNKVSFQLNLKGPSEVVDTACTSGYVALHRAIQSIYTGECEQAIVGGVNVISRLALQENALGKLTGLLSNGQVTRSFGDEGTGFVKSEGAGVLIIKPLKKARLDGDKILALVRGSAVYHGGRGFSLETPSAKGMKEVIKACIRKAGVNSDTIDYIEAHGVANRMADAIELGAINEAYKELSSNPEKKWNIGSVKPTVGHPELASGIVSIIKVIMAFRNKTIPGISGLDIVNKELDPGHSMILKSESGYWSNGVYPRRAGLNSYAVGGMNAHVILEEYKNPVVDPAVAANNENV